MRGRWELTGEQWEVVEPVPRPRRRADKRGRPWQDTRAVLHGVLWVLGTAAQWRELPAHAPSSGGRPDQPKIRSRRRPRLRATLLAIRAS